jgi:hypothetical protein
MSTIYTHKDQQFSIRKNIFLVLYLENKYDELLGIILNIENIQYGFII